MSKSKFSFVCVCHKGELEIQTLLLMTSLRMFAKVEYELAVAIPEPSDVWGKPAPATMSFLSKMGVVFHSVRNPISVDYPIGNKLECLGIETDADRLVFLDSDILCIRPFQDDPVFENRLCARLASLPGVASDDENWKRIYELLDLDIPSIKVESTVSGEMMLPYYNAGMIAVDPAINFSDAWVEVSRLLDAEPEVIGKRPYLDQLAIPVAAVRLGEKITALDCKYNFPPRLGEKVANDIGTIFYHYNKPEVALHSPRVLKVVREIARRFPIIDRKLRESQDWAQLL